MNFTHYRISIDVHVADDSKHDLALMHAIENLIRRLPETTFTWEEGTVWEERNEPQRNES
jgi:hypothetical protein